jgi:hypothetical protein
VQQINGVGHIWPSLFVKINADPGFNKAGSLLQYVYMLLQRAVYVVASELMDRKQDRYEAKFVEDADVDQGRRGLEAIDGRTPI